MSLLSERKLGRFRISMKFLSTYQGLMHLIMGTVIPLEVHYSFEYDAFEYLALSHSFDTSEVGCVAPTYIPTINEDRTLSWQKQQDPS